MEARTKKVDNSNETIIFNNSLNLKINDKLRLKLEDNKISLKERFLKYSGENLAKDFTWDSPRGKEIW